MLAKAHFQGSRAVPTESVLIARLFFQEFNYDECPLSL